MKSTVHFLLLLTGFLTLTTACENSFTKARYLRSYESWIRNLEIEYKQFTDEDWLRAETDFNRFSKIEYTKYEEGLTAEERERVDYLTGCYFAIKTKYQASKIEAKLNSMINKARGFMDELQKE